MHSENSRICKAIIIRKKENNFLYKEIKSSLNNLYNIWFSHMLSGAILNKIFKKLHVTKNDIFDDKNTCEFYLNSIFFDNKKLFFSFTISGKFIKQYKFSVKLRDVIVIENAISSIKNKQGVLNLQKNTQL